ncbi:unnamed protein product [Amoebophrya sp. A120]|nr:unnamed protein product [Amoebophrya sp. A120]|eukprot:GSA120T00005630001.1
MPSSQSPVKKFFIEEPYVSPVKPKNDTEVETILGKKKTPEKNDDAEQDLLAEVEDVEEPKPLVKIKDALEQAAIAEPAVAKAEIDEADKMHYCSKAKCWNFVLPGKKTCGKDGCQKHTYEITRDNIASVKGHYRKSSTGSMHYVKGFERAGGQALKAMEHTPPRKGYQTKQLLQEEYQKLCEDDAAAAPAAAIEDAAGGSSSSAAKEVSAAEGPEKKEDDTNVGVSGEQHNARDEPAAAGPKEPATKKRKMSKAVAEKQEEHEELKKMIEKINSASATQFAEKRWDLHPRD